MEKEEILEKYADIINAESCVHAYILDGALYYKYEWLNTVEMMAEVMYFCIDGVTETEDPRGDIVPLGCFYKAEKKGEKIK